MNSGENVHAENSTARRGPLVGDVGPAVLHISTVSTYHGWEREQLRTYGYR